MINIKSTLVNAILGVAIIFGGQSAAQAASPSLQPLASIAKQATADSGVEKVTYYKKSWRRHCAYRYGWHTRKFRSCLRRHYKGHYGHSSHYYRKWRRACAHRWGWNTWRFRRCLRRHDAY